MFFFFLLAFFALFAFLAIFSLAARVLGGVLGLFGLKSFFRAAANPYASETSAEEDSPLVRSELGAKRMRHFKELAQEAEYEEEHIEEYRAE